MCFSPEASFAGGVIISAIGVVTIRKVQKSSQVLFASIPLFFGIQQIAEGFVWMTIPLPEYIAVQKVFVYIFLIMAQVIWPVMIPLSVLFMEESKKKKKMLYILLGIGGLLSVYYATCLIIFHINPRIVGYHIIYYNDFPRNISIPATLVYLIATIPPLFISSLKRTHLLGMLMTFSCIVTIIFFRQYLTSVWCFFAAIISGVIYWILYDLKRVSLIKIPVRNSEGKIH